MLDQRRANFSLEKLIFFRRERFVLPTQRREDPSERKSQGCQT